MALSSMTGFARADGEIRSYAWAWELRSVNAKGLEIRLRLPPGFDAIEPAIRAKATAALARGTIQATLTVRREGVQPLVQVNQAVLDAVIAVSENISGRIKAAPPSVDGLLGIKGVIDVVEQADNEEDHAAAEAAIIAGFGEALEHLAAMRRHEGLRLGEILIERLDLLSALVARAEEAPGRKAEAIKARLSDQIALLLDSGNRFDPDRLHQEAILLASKADIREELDRLNAHVAQSRHLLKQGGAIGRRLDFLSQELNRESNTLCAKSNDGDLTNIGLELKAVVEQFREQVQNLE